MNNQEVESKEISEKEVKVRKKKILTDLERIRANCKICLEPGNLENMIRHGTAIKNSAGVELYGAFEYVYFCSESCKGVFGSLL